MKALFCTKDRKLSLQDIPVPEPTEDQIRIAIKFSGICRSDRHILDNDIALVAKLPIVLGHELSGVIDKVGKNVFGLSVGDSVSTETTTWSCGKCPSCLTGQYNLCSTRTILGYSANGAFEEFVVVPAERVHRLDGITLLQGSILEPLACCVRGAWETISAKKSDIVVISGLGTIGLLTAQIFRDRKLILYGRPQTSETRYRVARSLNPFLVTTSDIILDNVKEATDGLGADVFIECAGSLAAVNDGLNLLRRGGTFLQLGLQSKTDNTVVNFSQASYKALNITGSISSKHSSWEWAKRMVREQWVRPELIVSQPFYTLDQYREAFDAAQSNVGVKTIFQI